MVLEHLGIALKAELTAINQYFLHAKMNENWGYFRLGQHYRKESMEEMVRQTDQIINFTREVNRRIAESGLGGIEGLVTAYEQLRTALAKVSPQELDWAQGEVNRVLESLKRLSDELNHLAALKAALETGH